MASIVDRGNMQEAALHDAIRSIRRMSAGKRFQVEEWKIFFQQDGILEIISQDKFLRALGDCFTGKAIGDELYQVLEEQLGLVESYLQSRKIDLTSSSGSNPLTYAESKIECANDRYNKEKKYRNWCVVDTILWIIRAIVNGLYKLSRHWPI